MRLLTQFSRCITRYCLNLKQWFLNIFLDFWLNKKLVETTEAKMALISNLDNDFNTPEEIQLQ